MTADHFALLLLIGALFILTASWIISGLNTEVQDKMIDILWYCFVVPFFVVMYVAIFIDVASRLF